MRSRGAAFRTLTICTIGACSTNSSFASSSGLPGSAARSLTSAGWTALPCTTAALIFKTGVVLTNVVRVLASATGSFDVYATAGGVYRAVERPTYEDLVRSQIDAARDKSGPGDLQKLLRSGDSWVVK